MPMDEYLIIANVAQQRLEEPIIVNDTRMIEVVFGLESESNSRTTLFLPVVWVVSFLGN